MRMYPLAAGLVLAATSLGSATLGAMATGCARDATDRKLDSLMPTLEKMCACKDKACGDAVAVEYQAWFAANAHDESGKLTQHQSERLETIVGSMETCRSRAGGPSTMVP